MIIFIRVDIQPVVYASDVARAIGAARTKVEFHLRLGSAFEWTVSANNTVLAACGSDLRIFSCWAWYWMWAKWSDTCHQVFAIEASRTWRASLGNS